MEVNLKNVSIDNIPFKNVIEFLGVGKSCLILQYMYADVSLEIFSIFFKLFFNDKNMKVHFNININNLKFLLVLCQHSDLNI